MSDQASAVTTVDSAPTATEFNGWDEQGTPIRVEADKTSPTKQDSAPADKDNAAPDSAPEKKDQKDSKKTADSASDSASDKDAQKPHQKTKEDTERRIQELLEDRKTLQRRLEALERAKPSEEKRDEKPVSQPVKEEYKPLDEKKYFADNPRATYEDFVRAAAKHEAKWEARQEVTQAIAQERQRIQQEAATKEQQVKFNDAVTRYGQEEADKIFPALGEIVSDPQIPLAVKAMLNDSDVLADLVYVLQSDAGEFKKFLTLARSNPAAAIRKLVTTEALVQEQLKGKSAAAKAEHKDGADKSGNSTPARGDDGKFQSSKDKDGASDEVKPRAPKPPSEVGGRGTSTEDALRSAAAANDFRAFEAEQTRRVAARMNR